MKVFIVQSLDGIHGVYTTRKVAEKYAKKVGYDEEMSGRMFTTARVTAKRVRDA